ncbi:YqgE/AlgH family protein [Gayadomonas joobiniege]|uniref:YqgE/AlgH family protein n=1 Tax=Gayadomonas joobiniege TaxID=1234606 RepID=UPI00037B0468|nr:YqgE/AlgH family protein [Gayadomonas joobiniege]
MEYFQNHLLIAMPSLKDGYFERTVTYVCEHNEKGAMGIVINQAIDMKLPELLEQVKISTEDKQINPDTPVFLGGPVNNERGFVLHTPQDCWKSSMKLSDELMVTTSKDILESFGTPSAPEQYLICLGYAGWDAGQLEKEIIENSWITLPATADFVFNTPIHLKWQTATEALGFAAWQISGESGHA